jgi:4-hydroxybenzoate polyprenyltransferase
MLDKNDLKELRRKRLLDIILWSILNEAGIFSLFLLILFVVTFFNLNNSSFIYNQLFKSTFDNKQSQNEQGLNNVIFAIIFCLFII